MATVPTFDPRFCLNPPKKFSKKCQTYHPRTYKLIHSHDRRKEQTFSQMEENHDSDDDTDDLFNQDEENDDTDDDHTDDQFLENDDTDDDQTDDQFLPPVVSDSDNQVPDYSGMPADIVMYIFLKLPVKSILICRCLCKKWLYTLSSPDFVRFQLENSQSNTKFLIPEYKYFINGSLYDSFCIMDCDDSSTMSVPLVFEGIPEINDGVELLFGTCDGLICTSAVLSGERCIVIWNPSTREYKKIENKTEYHKFGLIGFVYDSYSNDYKILIHIYQQVDVYSLKTNTWRTVFQMSPQDKFHFLHDDQRDMYVNNSLYWLMSDSESRKSVPCGIKKFDLKSEKFTDLKLPQLIQQPQLIVIGECLGMYSTKSNNNNYDVIDIWKYDVGEWFKLESIPCRESWWLKPSDHPSPQRISFFNKRKESFFIVKVNLRSYRVLEVCDPNMRMQIVKTVTLPTCNYLIPFGSLFRILRHLFRLIIFFSLRRTYVRGLLW